MPSETARAYPRASRRALKMEARMRQLESIIDAIPPQTLAAIEAGIYTEESGGPSGPWSVVHSPRGNGSEAFAMPQHYPGLGYHEHAAPVYRGMAHTLGDTTGYVHAPSSKFFVDEHGDTQWHGSTSGLPLLEMLVHAHGYRSLTVSQYGAETLTMPGARVNINSGRDSNNSISPEGSSASPSSSSPSSISPSSLTGGSGLVMGMDDEYLASSEISDDGSMAAITWGTISSAIPAELMDE
jgi:hypothetical protein